MSTAPTIIGKTGVCPFNINIIWISVQNYFENSFIVAKTPRVITGAEKRKEDELGPRDLGASASRELDRCV